MNLPMLKEYVLCLYDINFGISNFQPEQICPSAELQSLSQDIVKADAGHVGVETYISQVFSSWAVFRPQYMIGSGNNKDCEEWFFDRKRRTLNFL